MPQVVKPYMENVQALNHAVELSAQALGVIWPPVRVAEAEIMLLETARGARPAAATSDPRSQSAQ
jgi:hypothetical protein